MFCKECGAKCDDEAKFCGACGTSLSGEAITATLQEKTVEEKVFFNSGGVLVSDAVFKTSTGASYPIRNISSVAVESNSESAVLFFAVMFIGAGIFFMAISFVVGLIPMFIGILLLWGYANRKSLLKIGAGGVLQTAIESSDRDYLQGIAQSINEAILYMQRGK